jgi:hypothetical protein
LQRVQGGAQPAGRLVGDRLEGWLARHGDHGLRIECFDDGLACLGPDYDVARQQQPYPAVRG